jgi:hypothetical protein
MPVNVPIPEGSQVKTTRAGRAPGARSVKPLSGRRTAGSGRSSHSPVVRGTA